MPVFWITINPADLQFLLIICFVGVKLELPIEIQFGFYCKTATMNPVAVAKFFHIICNLIFMSLFAASQIKKGLLGLILNYFATIKINGCRMFYFHYFVWQKNVSHLAIL